MRKLFRIVVALGVVFGGSAVAGEVSMKDLLKKEESLYRTILENYTHKRDASAQLAELEKVNLQLKSLQSHGEVANLIAYFDLCFQELRLTVQTPYSRQNEEIISDLGDAVSEGSRQILQAKGQKISLAR